MATATQPFGSPQIPDPQTVSDEGLLAFAELEPLAKGLSDVQPAGAPGALMADLRTRS